MIKLDLVRLRLSRGIIETPTFMPVGTQGTIKGVFIDDILSD